MDAYASGLESLKELSSEATHDVPLNEATTRLRVIDRLLMDVLGWPSSEIEAEGYDGGEYVDYSVGTPAQMIVEAKREGITFSLPAGLAGKRTIELSTICSDPDVNAAIIQVTRYCQVRGVPVAVATNGRQLVAFLASRQDGVPPLKGRALCFSSLDEMISDFATLWRNLSRPGMTERNLQRALLGKSRRPQAPSKLSAEIYNYPGFRSRTALETDLKILGGLFIQDLEDEAAVSNEFLIRCYCSTGALSQYALVSKEVLRARYDSVTEVTEVQIESVRDKRGTSQALTADVMAAALSRRPIIVLGDVGVGKSMFLRHLIRIEAADVLQADIVFYVDFGKEPALATDLQEYVARRMNSILVDEYGVDIDDDSFVRAVYNGEINRFRRGIYMNLATEDPKEFGRREIEHLESLVRQRESHIKRSLEHLRATSGRKAVVVLDNVDQRPSEFQERVFLISQALAETWPVTVFVALRPSTFFESRQAGSLAAYQPRVFTVNPTRADEVIARRLEYAKDALQQAQRQGSFPAKLSLSGDDLEAYLEALSKAFTQNERLKELIDNLSGGNLRLALTFLASFVGSGYVSTKRVLEVAESGDVYTVPIHEVLRAIIYGDYEYFDPSASEICNILDIRTNDGREHFLLPILLAFVQASGESGGGQGFIAADIAIEFGRKLGFDDEQIGPQLKRAVAKRLLDVPSGRSTEGPYRITSVGAYMCRSMLSRFVYIDAVVVDTPIVDPQVRRHITDVRSIADRLNRAVAFRAYLDSQWSLLGEPPQGVLFDWMSMSMKLEQDISEVRVRAERAALKREYLERKR